MTPQDEEVIKEFDRKFGCNDSVGCDIDDTWRVFQGSKPDGKEVLEYFSSALAKVREEAYQEGCLQAESIESPATTYQLEQAYQKGKDEWKLLMLPGYEVLARQEERKRLIGELDKLISIHVKLANEIVGSSEYHDGALNTLEQLKDWLI